MTEQNQPGPESADAAETKKKGRKGFGINFKVSAKGAVSVYGLGRFPVTLYREQWLRLLERTDDLRQFMDQHAEELKSKAEAQEAASGQAPPAAPEAPAAPAAPAEPEAPASEEENVRIEESTAGPEEAPTELEPAAEAPAPSSYDTAPLHPPSGSRE